MHRLAPFAALLTLALSLLVVLPVAAVADGISTDPNQPTPLDADVQGTVAASGFAYLAFTYPGDGSSVAITMTYTMTDPARDAVIGFHVYGPTATLIGAGTQSNNPLGTKYLQFSSTNPGTYLLQIYDYTDMPVDFGVTTEGQIAAAAPGPAATPTALPLPTPIPPPGTVTSSADHPLPISRAHNVILTGSNAGNYDFYVLRSDTDSDVTLTLNVSPNLEVHNRTAGFTVYLNGSLAATSSISDSTPWAAVATFHVTASADYLVQVYNYDQART